MRVRGNITSIVKIERICSKIFLMLLKRDLRYLVVTLPMYLRSIHSPYRCHVLRASYCFARYLDDVLDGDIRVDEEIIPYVKNLMAEVRKTKSETDNDYVVLGKYVYEHVDQFANHDALPSEELDELIEDMIFDRQRADRRLLLSREALDRHHFSTFMSSLYVTLDVVGAHYTPEDIEPLAKAQARLYSLRDLQKDLTSGINNIPRHILYSSKLPPSDYWNFGQISRGIEVKEWIYREFKRGYSQLSEFEERLKNNTNFQFRATTKPLFWGLSHLQKKLKSQYDLKEISEIEDVVPLA